MERFFSTNDLRSHAGTGGKPIYICVLGRVYDVSAKPQFYGPGTAYGIFAGHDATRCLAKMSITPEDLDKPITDLTPDEHHTLRQWVTRFQEQYPIVGFCAQVEQ